VIAYQGNQSCQGGCIAMKTNSNMQIMESSP
jgi:hypothetical protein